MEQRLTIITLGVTDLKKSSKFYEEVFGWKKMPSSNEHISFFRLNGMLLSLYPKEKLAEDATVKSLGDGFKAFTLAFNTKTKAAVDELIETLERRGVTVVKKPKATDWGGYSGYVEDLDSTLWEIAFNPFLALDEKGNIMDG